MNIPVIMPNLNSTRPIRAARTLKSIELFAGAGGLAMGLNEAGFRPLNVIEWDADCCATLMRNKAHGSSLKGWKHITESDVQGIDFRPYDGKVALVSGGPPCQPFSLGGRHKAHDDLRDMFPQAIRAVREARPKAFIFENVKGLTRASFRNYFEYIRLQLRHPDVIRRKGDEWTDHLKMLERYETSHSRAGLHYNVVAKVLNAANFGVPQRRERVFFVGFRSDIDAQWSFPAETHSAEALNWDMAHGDYWDRHKVAKRLRKSIRQTHEKSNCAPWLTVRDALQGLPEPIAQRESVEFANHRLQLGARTYPGHTGSPIDEPAKTLKAGVHGVPGGENMMRLHDGSVRYFTIREAARLQTFPDDYVFQGSWSEAMRQLGNAVPVTLAAIVGKSVIKHLETLR